MSRYRSLIFNAIFCLFLAVSSASAAPVFSMGFEGPEGDHPTMQQFPVVGDSSMQGDSYSGSYANYAGLYPRGTKAYAGYCHADSEGYRGFNCDTNSDCGSGTCLADPGNYQYLALSDGTSPPTIPLIQFIESDSSLGCYVQIEPECAHCSVSTARSCAKDDDCPGSQTCEVTETCEYFNATLYYEASTNVCNGGTNDGTLCTPCSSDSECTIAAGQGYCVGDANVEGANCSSNADCTGGGTCTDSTCFNPGSNGACKYACRADNDGEQWCLNSAKGASFKLYYDTWYDLVLKQDNTVGTANQVRCSLVEGGFQRAASSHNAGHCDDNLWSCSTNGDCNAGAVCDGNIDTVSEVRIGLDSRYVDLDSASYGFFDASSTMQAHVLFAVPTQGLYPTGNWILALDNIVVDTDVSNDISIIRTKVLYPDALAAGGEQFGQTSGGSGCGNGSSTYLCIDDAADGSCYGGASTDGIICTTNADCTSPDVCIYPEWDEDRIEKGTGSTGSGYWTMSNITLESDESLLDDQIVTLYGYRADGGTDTTDTDPEYTRICLDDGTNSQCFAACSSNTDCLGPDQVCYSSACWDNSAAFSGNAGDINGWGLLTVFDTDDTSTEWNTTSINAMEVRIDRDSSSDFYIYYVLAEVPVKVAAPSPPGILDDVNADSSVTFCFTGDSTVNQSNFQYSIIGELIDVDNFIACTRGGAQTGDIAYTIQGILDGSSGSDMNCQIKKGDYDVCDYLMVISSANDTTSSAYYHPYYCNGGSEHGTPCKVCSGGSEDGFACSDNSDCNDSGTCDVTCTGGTCQFYPGYCYGGADHGNPCTCPFEDYSFSRAFSPSRLCLRDGVNFGTTTTCAANPLCATNSDCGTGVSCSANSDCAGGFTCSGSECVGSCSGALCWRIMCDGGSNDGGDCSTNTDCPGGGTCDYTGNELFAKKQYGSSLNPDLSTYQSAGCTGANNCASGVCIASQWYKSLYYEYNFDKILAEVNSRVGSGTGCTTDCAVEPIIVTQPAGSHLGAESSTTSGSWSYAQTAATMGSGNARMLSKAKKEGYNFIDVASCYSLACGGDPTRCHGDNIHWTTYGYEVVANCILDCLLNRDGTSNGVCVTNTCTSGRIGGDCATNGDCDTYRCDFGP